MKNAILTSILALSSLHIFGQSATKFTKEAVREDLKYLYESLEDAHYNLYAYVTKQDFDLAYERVQNSITKESLNLLDATVLFQQLISMVNNGHTEISFPGQSYAEYAYAGGTLFPLEIAFENNRSFIRKNWSEDTGIHAGSEILGINGASMTEILAKIYPQISAERQYFKHAKIELYSFPRLYWLVFGKQNDFEIEILSDGVVKKHTIKAVDVIEGFEARRTEVLNAEKILKFYGPTAYLNPGNFSGDEIKYQAFIDSSFVKIKEHYCKNLIIDLRNNAGGDDSFSDYLVSYFADKPFKWNSNFALKTSKFLKEHTRKHNDTTSVYWQNVLKHEDGEIYTYDFEAYLPQPEQKRFAGKVYVLVNRQSHSQSAVTAAQIQDYDFGAIATDDFINQTPIFGLFGIHEIITL